MPTSDIKGMYSRNWIKALLLHFYFLPLLHFYFLPLLHFISCQSCIFISWPLCTFISCPSCSLALLFLAPLALLFLFTLRNTLILAPLALFSAPCDNSAHDQGQSSWENAKKYLGWPLLYLAYSVSTFSTTCLPKLQTLVEHWITMFSELSYLCTYVQLKK